MFIYYWRTCKKLCAGRSVITSIFVSGNNFGGVMCYLSDAFARPWPVTASHGMKIHFCSLASGTRAHVPPPHSPRAQLLHGRSCSNKQQQTDNLLPTLISVAEGRSGRLRRSVVVLTLTEAGVVAVAQRSSGRGEIPH